MKPFKFSSLKDATEAMRFAAMILKKASRQNPQKPKGEK